MDLNNQKKKISELKDKSFKIIQRNKNKKEKKECRKFMIYRGQYQIKLYALWEYQKEKKKRKEQKVYLKI